MTIEAQNIRKEYIREGIGTNRYEVVKRTDFRADSGTISVIRGRSGSGKSTFVGMLCGITSPTEGRVLYDGKDIFAGTDKERSAFRNAHIGYIPQGRSALMALNVMENIRMPAALYHKESEKVTAYARALMERLDILHLASAMPAELSGGELRRMAIARALLLSPEVLFADEPTGDLDDENTKVVWDELRRAAADGSTVILVTHEDEAEAYADAVYRMDAGVLVRN